MCWMDNIFTTPCTNHCFISLRPILMFQDRQQQHQMLTENLTHRNESNPLYILLMTKTSNSSNNCFTEALK
jgi:hypothetical protein